MKITRQQGLRHAFGLLPMVLLVLAGYGCKETSTANPPVDTSDSEAVLCDSAITTDLHLNNDETQDCSSPNSDLSVHPVRDARMDEGNEDEGQTQGEGEASEGEGEDPPLPHYVLRGGSFQSDFLVNSRTRENKPDWGGVDIGVRCASDSVESIRPSYRDSFLCFDAGEFVMGSDTAPMEMPTHSVTVFRFCIMRSEVTASQYLECITSGNCDNNTSGGDSCALDVDELERPINCQPRDDLKKFCEYAGGRLPTEAEWEFAATSEGTTAPYPWGHEAVTCDAAVVGRDACGNLTSKMPCSQTAGNSQQGICDLIGNVREWVEDCWHTNYNNAPSNSAPWSDDCLIE